MSLTSKTDQCKVRLIFFQNYWLCLKLLYYVYCTLCSGFSSIMVPIQSSLTVTLPMSKGSHQDHNPFPGEIPYIVKFNEKVCRQWQKNYAITAVMLQVEILASLQKPKKISILASDGKSYTMLCKPEVCMVTLVCLQDLTDNLCRMI